jgi:hypothetical protein
VADVEGEVGVLLHDQHRQSVIAIEVTELCEQLAGHEGGQTQRGLVEQQQAGTGHHCPRQRQHLLLAAAHAAGLLVAAFGQAGKHRVPAVEVGPDAAVVAVDGPDAQVLLDGEIRERAPSLRDVGDPQAGHRFGRTPEDRATTEQDLTLRVDQAADGAQRRGLAGTVGAEDHRHVPLLDPEIDVVEHPHGPVAAAHVGDLEEAHRRTSTRPQADTAPPPPAEGG